MFTSLDEEESHTIEDLFVCLTKRTMNCNGNRDEIDDKKKHFWKLVGSHSDHKAIGNK